MEHPIESKYFNASVYAIHGYQALCLQTVLFYTHGVTFFVIEHCFLSFETLNAANHGKTPAVFRLVSSTEFTCQLQVQSQPCSSGGTLKSQRKRHFRWDTAVCEEGHKTFSGGAFFCDRSRFFQMFFFFCCFRSWWPVKKSHGACSLLGYH